MGPEILPVVLCLMSALTVAITNVMVKRGGDVLTTRAIVAIVMGLTVVPFAPFVPLPPAGTWGLIFLSMAVHWLYQFCAIRALHRGDGPPLVRRLLIRDPAHSPVDPLIHEPADLHA